VGALHWFCVLGVIACVCTSDMLVVPSSMQGHSFLRRACYKVSDGNPSFAEMNAVSPFHALSFSSSFIFVMYCSSRHITILTLSLLGAALISLSLSPLFVPKTYTQCGAGQGGLEAILLPADGAHARGPDQQASKLQHIGKSWLSQGRGVMPGLLFFK